MPNLQLRFCSLYNVLCCCSTRSLKELQEIGAKEETEFTEYCENVIKMSDEGREKEKPGGAEILK